MLLWGTRLPHARIRVFAEEYEENQFDEMIASIINVLESLNLYVEELNAFRKSATTLLNRLKIARQIQK